MSTAPVTDDSASSTRFRSASRCALVSSAAAMFGAYRSGFSWMCRLPMAIDSSSAASASSRLPASVSLRA
jgi:hypothetical protein